MELNYITIQGWMISKLNLSGNNLLTYALIFGFTQDGESEFSGSINYVCKWLNCSRPTASKSLSELTQSGLLIKSSIVVNNVTFNRYKIDLLVVKNLYGGSKESLRGGSKESLHNNNNIDINKDINKNNILPKNKFSEDVYKVFEHTVLLFKEEYRPSTESQKNNWLDCIDKLNRIDGMEYREIYKMVKWGLEHNFWNKNFYTILKLRKKNSEGISFLNVFKSQMEFETKQVKTGSISTEEMIKKMAK